MFPQFSNIASVDMLKQLKKLFNYYGSIPIPHIYELYNVPVLNHMLCASTHVIIQ